LVGGDPYRVVPVIWQRLHHWDRPSFRAMLSDGEFLRDQIHICTDLGITRFCLWGKPTRVIEQGTTSAYVETDSPGIYEPALKFMGGHDVPMNDEQINEWLGEVYPKHVIELLLTELGLN